jgi:anti-anti-sigma regulatory factor
MLKITEVSRNDSAITFKLEGKVLAACLDELRSVCTQPVNRLRQIRLDLDAVTFVDSAGAGGKKVMRAGCDGAKS